MNLEMIAFIALAVVSISIVGFFIDRRVPKKLKAEDFTREWRELQGLCKDKAEWPQAIRRADALLDRALKRRKFKGKSMGERMVSAQRKFTNNDDLWFAHNFHKKLLQEPGKKLKDVDVKEALMGFRQALKDLGAFQQTEIKADKSVEAEAKK